ncbi:hypothetical protein Tco_0747209 [Tanacetum coccineum]
MNQNGVSDDALRLSLFPYSLTHHAIAWYDRIPRNSIDSFDDMMRKFLSKYFPPSMRYKLSIDRCPNHNMLLVTQIDTFYNGLTLSHWDTINAAAGGTFMQKTPEECYELIKNMTAHHNHWDTSATRDETSRNISSTTTTESPEVVQKLEMMNKTFLDMMRQIQSVQFRSPKCETCGGPHSFTECPTVDGYTQEAAYATTSNHNSGGLTLQVDDEAITFTVGQTSRHSYNDAVSINRIDVIDVACEEYAQEVLRFSDSSTSGDPTPSLDPILSTSSCSLIPFEEGDFILEEIEDCLTNNSIPLGINNDNFDPEGDLLLLKKLLNNDPSSPLPPKELHVEELNIVKYSIDDPPELELKDLPSHYEYAFLEGTDKLPVIIAKDLKEDERV